MPSEKEHFQTCLQPRLLGEQVTIKEKNQEKKITINTQTTIRDHYQIRQIKEFSLLI